MNNNDALIYCISAKTSLQKLGDNSSTMLGIKEEAKQWAIHCSNYSFNEMRDLVLKSTHHQRYQNGIPVMGDQYCNRTIKIENKAFKEMFNGLDVNPKEGFLVTMWNMDTLTPTPQMQPKLMEMVADTGDKILLRGVTLKAMGVVAYDNKDYGITLHLKNRNVVKCVLHMYDRGVNIEYDELIK